MITQIEHPKVVSRGEWLAVRKELLVKEKQWTRQRDRDGSVGGASYRGSGSRRIIGSTDLMDSGVWPISSRAGASSSCLISCLVRVGSRACVGCSFRSDHVDGALVHLEHHDVSLVTVSRAPLAEIEAFKKRMGWRFPWLSSFGSEFNYDFQVSFKKEEIATGRVTYNYEVRDFVTEEASGLSVFCKNAGGEIFHTYSTFGRGDEMVDTTYMYLDLTPKGRNENGPHHNLGDWVRRHDGWAAGFVDAGGRFVAEVQSKAECGCGHKE